MKWLFLAGGFAGGAIVATLYIRGTIKAKGHKAIDDLLPAEYGGPIKELWSGLTDDQFSIGGTSERGR